MDWRAREKRNCRLSIKGAFPFIRSRARSQPRRLWSAREWVGIGTFNVEDGDEDDIVPGSSRRSRFERWAPYDTGKNAMGNDDSDAEGQGKTGCLKTRGENESREGAYQRMTGSGGETASPQSLIRRAGRRLWNF